MTDFKVIGKSGEVKQRLPAVVRVGEPRVWAKDRSTVTVWQRCSDGPVRHATIELLDGDRLVGDGAGP